MATKTNLTVYLDAKVTILAHEMGLNISKTCEIALKQAINRLQGTNSEIKGIKQFSGAKIGLVDRGGFEPPTSALRTRRSYQTDLPAQRWHFVKEKKGVSL